MSRVSSASGRRLANAALLAAAAVACVSAQPAAPAFDGQRALDHVKRLVAIGPRVAGSSGSEQAQNYILNQMKALGLPVREQRFTAKTPVGPVRMTNLRVTLPGAAAAGRLLLAGHYDTKLFQDSVFVGANDGGSSAAFLIEIARVLKERRNPLSIELVFFDGEEAIVDWHKDNDHTYGSQYYVDAARSDGTLKDIRALILVDMIGDRDLRILREPRSTRWLTDVIWQTAKQLKRGEFVDEEFEVEDDHIPFLQAGVAAVDLIDLDYPDWHQPGDTVDKLSAASLQAVGDVLLAALPEIEKRLLKP